MFRREPSLIVKKAACALRRWSEHLIVAPSPTVAGTSADTLDCYPPTVEILRYLSLAWIMGG